MESKGVDSMNTKQVAESKDWTVDDTKRRAKAIGKELKRGRAGTSYTDEDVAKMEEVK
jgi:hypothetical protein